MPKNTLLNKLYLARKNEKNYTFEVLKYLKLVNQKRLYVSEGSSGLMNFCVDKLGYTKQEAYIRVNSVYAMEAVPVIECKIKDESISLSTASELNKFFKQESPDDEKKEKLIKEVEGKSKRESVKIINSFKEEPAEEKLTITISERLLKKIRSLQEDFGDNTEIQVLEALVDEKIRKKEFVKPERKKAQKGSKNQRYIARVVKKKVFRNSNHKCEKCKSGVNLQIDHIKPIKLGGQSHAENLQILCFSCNQYKEVASKSRDRHNKVRQYQLF